MASQRVRVLVLGAAHLCRRALVGKHLELVPALVDMLFDASLFALVLLFRRHPPNYRVSIFSDGLWDGEGLFGSPKSSISGSWGSGCGEWHFVEFLE